MPPDAEAVVMTIVPDPLAAALLGAALPGADDAAGALLAAALLLLLLLLLLLPLAHAAASTATPTAPPTPAASLTEAGIRLILESFIVFVSRLARLSRASSPLPKCLSLQVRREVRTRIGRRAANVG